jgi:GTPase SAR1 family protein
VTRLRDRIDSALTEAHDLLPASAADIRHQLAAERAALQRKFQVAVVGRVSSGKSTLVNALVGERIAPTGVLELTFNVNHLRRGRTRSVTARLRGGETVRLDGLVALEQYAAVQRFTARTDANRDELRPVEHVEVVLDSPWLELFDLIDTPGLNSVYGEEEAKTLAGIGLTAQDVLDRSGHAASGAEALLVVIDDRLASARDEKLLADFRGPRFADRTPVTTLGALTKVENLWDPDEPTPPMALAQRNAERLLRTGALGDLLFEIVPVCGLVAEAATTLVDADLADLRALSAVPLLDEYLADGAVFTAEEAGLPLTGERRAELHRRFTPYGVHLACARVRDGVDTVAVLRSELDTASGLPRLRKRLADHFGRRADLIRLATLLAWNAELPKRHEQRLPPADRQSLYQAVGVVERLEHDEHGLAELALLHRLLRRDSTLPADLVRTALRAIGEHGGSVAERLDCAGDIAELERLAHEHYLAWAPHARPGVDGMVRRTLRETYRRLLENVRAARRQLEEPW